MYTAFEDKEQSSKTLSLTQQHDDEQVAKTNATASLLCANCPEGMGAVTILFCLLSVWIVWILVKAGAME